MRRVLIAATAGLLVPLSAPLPYAGLLSPAVAVESGEACHKGGPQDQRGQATTQEGVLPDSLNLAALPVGVDGKGVKVAVIDSGISPQSGLGATSLNGSRAVVDGHGTMVAGLIRAVAPRAELLSYRVIDAREEYSTEDGQDTTVTGAEVARGITAAVGAGARVINLSLTSNADAELTAALQLAEKRGVLVVAAVGNRPRSDDQGQVSGKDAFHPGEDRVAIPARLPGVLGVTGLAEDGSLDPDDVMTGPGVDLSAPGQGARTVDAGGRGCLVGSAGSSWGTAVVSGVAALLVQQEPGRTSRELAGQLMATAQGGMRDAAFDGHGMVQPVAALTAEIAFDSSGDPVGLGSARPETAPVPAPEPPEDLSGPRRTALLWWGLGAGGVLVGALLLRPLAVRRRED